MAWCHRQVRDLILSCHFLSSTHAHGGNSDMGDDWTREPVHLLTFCSDPHDKYLYFIVVMVMVVAQAQVLLFICSE